MFEKIFNKYFRHFGFFYSYIGPKLILLILMSLFVGLLDGFGLALFMPIFQIAADGDSLSTADNMGDLKFLLTGIEWLGFDLTLNSVVVFMVVLFFLKAIFKFLDGYIKIKLQNQFVKKIRFQMVDGLSDLDYKHFLNLDSGKVQNTLSSEAVKITYGFLSYFNSIQHLVLLLVYIGLAFLSNFQFAILVSIGGYLSNFLFRYFFSRTEKESINLSSLGHQFQSYLIQAVHNFKYLKATDYFSSYNLKLKSVINQIEHGQKKIGIYGSIMASLREPIILVVVMIIILIQVNFMEGSLSTIILSLVFFYRSLNYVVTLQGSWQGFISNIGGVISSVNLINDFKDGKETFNKTDEIKKISALDIQSASFVYPNGFQVLKQVNLEIEPLKTYAFVGESGSGKTTLVNMLIGLFHPSEGKIIVNNQDRSEVDLSSYRKRFGYITQEPVIFNDNIYNNVTLWAEKSEENLSKFQKAVSLANIHNFIDSLPEKESTRLGDNGVMVSGGQKQRISIARELYKDVDVLIFDEATSALDSETEKLIQDNIDMLMGKFTMIIIAHRLSTIRKVDTISLMDKGRVIASGKFEDLVSENGQFKRMVELQEFN
ncbi:ABC transporter ATP-binding protein [Algoriphagus machipongonensis]|uniref:Multidrug resistance-like ATP-binding protein MdlB n=1 Tax=Algoriphagus machipongonensis TaxID=388413 RepID=A3I1Y8_9BACT|nr:ABC transporter ATP-binding protein/permease [Algoriphagus machipongonensis]EAZ79804.2 putative ABC transporter, ATP-binding protein [Algoriphagus machipongonensis]